MVAEKYVVRQSVCVQQSLESGDLDKLSGLQDPEKGLTKVQSDMVPLPRLLESGAFRPGILGHLRGGSPRGDHGG